ncbi:MAG: hypothetical protein IJM43_08195 [Bacteroidaceae bacterium]|nr:hypothetical protein [Bacteroidaceae bacterium]
MKDKSYINLGWFDSITQVWELYPEGGHEGEYFYVDSKKYRWNKTTRSWEYAATDPVAGGNTVVGNDLTVNNNATIGADLKVRENTRVEKDLHVGGKIYAKGVKQPNCGFFSSEETLKAAHPVPEVGMWATVGATMPGTLWRCETAGVWYNTGATGGVDPTEVNYGTENRLDSDSTEKALSAAMGAKLQDEKLGVVPQGLTEDQKMQAQANMGMDKIVDGLRKRTGYLICSTPWYVQSKVVSAPNFELYPGGCIKIKMLYHNTAANPTLNINNTGPRLLYFDNKVAAECNTWLDGEVIEVYYNGEFYFANSIDGGATFKTGERVRDLGIDHKPIKDSENLITSGGVYDAMEDLYEDWDELLENYKPIVINGDVVNAPDEEDITMDENSLLKFKNRGTLFGKGYVILRRGKTVAEQIVKENTIYQIKYDFDMGGETVTMPEGCVLQFEGGSLTNGTLISNHTIVQNISSVENTDCLRGTFYTEYGSYLNYNQKAVIKFNAGLESGFIAPNNKVYFRYWTQSIAVTEQYVLLLGVVENASPQYIYFLLFDRDYNYLGTCRGGVGHANDCTICDGKLYVGWCGQANDQTHVYDLYEIIEKCQMDTTPYHTTTYDNIVTPISVMSLSSYSIDYDAHSEEFAVYTTSEIQVYDKNFNLKYERSINIQRYIEDKIQMPITPQSIVYKKGVVVFVAWLHRVNSVDYGSVINAVYDVFTDTVVDVSIIKTPYNYMEPEGAFKDPLDDNNIYCVYSLNGEEGIAGNVVAKLSQVNEIISPSSKADEGVSFYTKNREKRSYVDDSYTGFSNGTQLKPWKSLDQAIIMDIGAAATLDIKIKNNDTEYYLPFVKVQPGSHLMLMNYGSGGKPKIKGACWAYGGSLTLMNIDMVSSASTQAIYISGNGYALLSNVELTTDNNDSTAIKITDNGTAKLESNTIISGFNYGIDANYGRVLGTLYFEDCNEGLYIRQSILNSPLVSATDCEVALRGTTSVLNMGSINISGCTKGAIIRQSTLNIENGTFANCDRCFDLDDSEIHLSKVLSNFSFESCDSIIYKDVNYRNSYSLNIGINSQESYNALLSFIQNGDFSNTALAFDVIVAGLYDSEGNYIKKGKYMYDDTYIYNLGTGRRAIDPTANNYRVFLTSGISENRPVFQPNVYQDIGYEFFDTTLNKMIVWNGTGWYDANGDEVSDISSGHGG